MPVWLLAALASGVPSLYDTGRSGCRLPAQDGLHRLIHVTCGFPFGREGCVRKPGWRRKRERSKSASTQFASVIQPGTPSLRGDITGLCGRGEGGYRSFGGNPPVRHHREGTTKPDGNVRDRTCDKWFCMFSRQRIKQNDRTGGAGAFRVRFGR